ncbi:MAG: thermonuclease family protein [Woeseiaceae bacterium]
MNWPIRYRHHTGGLFRALAAAVLLQFLAGISVAETIEGKVVGITDGDTFTLLTPGKQQVKVRVAEIDAPERGQPYANRSRQKLAELLFQKEVSVQVQVVDRYKRPVGRPLVGDTDVTVEMIRAGAAWVYRTYSDDVALYELEREAKAGQRGLWSLPEYERVPPWEHRNGERREAGHEDPAAAFQCRSKSYCREMVSCDEARFHLESCGLKRLDGDGDGVPCEAICR